MAIDPHIDQEINENKILEEGTHDHHATASKTDEEKIAESTASGSLDIQAAEREMNRHLNEAGMLYQSLGESLRKMETVQKKVFLEQQSSVAKLNLLKSQLREQEEQIDYQKMVVKFLIMLALILGATTITLVMMIRKDTSQSQQTTQNEQNFSSIQKRLEALHLSALEIKAKVEADAKAKLEAESQPTPIITTKALPSDNTPTTQEKPSEITAPNNQEETAPLQKPETIKEVPEKQPESSVPEETKPIEATTEKPTTQVETKDDSTPAPQPEKIEKEQSETQPTSQESEIKEE